MNEIQRGEIYLADLGEGVGSEQKGMHLEYVLGCMKDNTTKIRNIKNYLLSALFNAPTTMGSYFQSEVSHDRACGII